MALKNERILYLAKNLQAGLADITAKIRRDGVTVAAAQALTDIGNGEYQLLLTPALLAGFGGAGFYDFYIDSASKSAPALAARWILANDDDDLEIHLSGLETKIDTIDTEVGNLQTDLTSVKATAEDSNTILNDASIGNANLKSLLDAITSITTNISNVVRFNAALLPLLVKQETGSRVYKVPVYIYDLNGNMEDPDLDQVQVSVTNAAGANRDSLLTGFTTQPYYASKNAQGDYEYSITIPDTAAIEPLIFKFNYLEGGAALVHKATTEVIEEANKTGLALEATAQDILTDTADIQPKVVTILAAIQDAGYGLAALQTLLNTIDANTDGVETTLGDATYGLSALRTQLDLKASQSSVNTLSTKVDNTQGVGFDTATDSQKAVSDRIYTGGSAV